MNRLERVGAEVGNARVFAHQAFVSLHVRDATVVAAGRDVVAVYADSSQTSYLTEGTDWRHRPSCRCSCIITSRICEDLKYECPEQRERLAYLAQDRWLGLFNRSLANEFELDPLSVLVKTRCLLEPKCAARPIRIQRVSAGYRCLRVILPSTAGVLDDARPWNDVRIRSKWIMNRTRGIRAFGGA